LWEISPNARNILPNLALCPQKIAELHLSLRVFATSMSFFGIAPSVGRRDTIYKIFKKTQWVIDKNNSYQTTTVDFENQQ
jgi:hypothetical protein